MKVTHKFGTVNLTIKIKDKFLETKKKKNLKIQIGKEKVQITAIYRNKSTITVNL